MTLSVAMCTYNGAKYLQEQLESILNQELSVNEIVICDDGSTDETLKIANEIATKHTNIKWNIQQNNTNQGVTKNFEKAITLCSGDIIFLSDQDDIWKLKKTRIISSFFIKHKDVNVIFTDADLIDSEGNLLTTHSMLDSIYLRPNLKYWNAGLKYEILAECNRATGATMALRKCFIPEFTPMVKQNWCLHDEQITMAAYQKNCLGLILDRLILYRQHGNNVLGVPVNNWVYTGEQCPNLLHIILRPCGVKDYCWRFKNVRMVFYQKRSSNDDSFLYRFKLVSLLPLYFFYYRRYWWNFLSYDLFPSTRN